MEKSDVLIFVLGALLLFIIISVAIGSPSTSNNLYKESSIFCTKKEGWFGKDKTETCYKLTEIENNER